MPTCLSPPSTPSVLRLAGRSLFQVPVPKGGAAITQLAPQTFYRGGHPTVRLADSAHGGFDVLATVDLLAPAAAEGTVSVRGGWPAAVAVVKRVSLVEGENSVVLTIPAAQTLGVKLWHPHGHGGQPRYSITAVWTPTLVGAPLATTDRLIGFRHAVLITTNDTDPATVAGAPDQNGTGQFTVRTVPKTARPHGRIQSPCSDV